ncbi:hypothetical protein PLESTB_000632200 [Pleodorina starrii]|uniref:Heat shock factor binding protein 1 n=1 Tax=Pleodorina starrii TaxID=330485 RepID=A0A9W6F133_9CHLO|nr:hypothetical protein PLESTM_001293200 [Pleodorina starrii]GLC52467.1 hypothetical protein PLESTB_000632200 [Pleodorina starrii]GLC69714.1 hypothetical protein PLESTF_000869300 [Pleodorina starrii]
MADKNADSGAELTNFVSGLLTQMQARFQTMSNNIVTKIDDMGQKIDSLEATIAELLEQTGPSDANAGKDSS